MNCEELTIHRGDHDGLKIGSVGFECVRTWTKWWTECPYMDHRSTRGVGFLPGETDLGWLFPDVPDDAFGNPEGMPGDILWRDMRWGDLLSIDPPEKQMETLEIWYARRRYTPERYGTTENEARKQPHLYDEMVERALVRSRQETHTENEAMLHENDKPRLTKGWSCFDE